MEASAVIAFLEANWSWSAQLAASMLALTVLASTLLNPARKEEIALWLMGAQTEQNWSRSFVWLFDAVFGDRHLSWRCFLRSAIASLIAVVLIWFLMGGFGDLKVRVRSELSLGAVLVMALAVNVVADYISLLETRWLLGRMHRLHSFFAQAAVLLLDLVISAAIIWLAILAYLNSPLHQGEIESFAEILGVFSVFSVIFYSTFLTSVWSWAYVLSTWILRLFRHLRLPDLLDVEHRPVLVLGHVLALVVFFVSLAVAVPMQKDAGGLSIADRALCSIFKGQVCFDVAKLTRADQAQLDLILLACEGGVVGECINRGLATYNENLEESARFWKVACEGGYARGCTGLGVLHYGELGMEKDLVEAARFFRRGCEGGDAMGCTYLGFLHRAGLGMDADPVEAARLYRQGCEGGSARGCSHLGFLHEKGLGMDADPVEAARLYRRGCEGGDALGCSNLGFLHQEGLGMDADPVEAARLYRQGCEGGSAGGCTGLGFLHQEGLGMDTDPVEAARLYRRGCEGGIAGGCTGLGFLHQKGLGMDADPVEAARLYRRGCEGGDALGCSNLGFLHRDGLGMDADPVEAARLYRRGCEGGNALGCTGLGFLHQEGLGMDADPVEAARLYRRGCEGGNALGCTGLGFLHQEGVGMEADPVEAARLYRRACELGLKSGCDWARELSTEQ